MQGAPVIEISGLTVKRDEVVVLSLDSFTLEDREVLVLIGPNGAGKTTLLQTILRLIPAHSGSILFKSRDALSIEQPHAYRRHFGMVFQEPLLFNTRVYDNIVSGLRIRGMPAAEMKRRAEEEMKRFGIAHLADRLSRTLSGGEAQRTSLARAFAVRPEVLLLDEPFASLDNPTRESITADLERAIRDTGTSMIMATHDRDEALRIADRLAVMQDGRIIQTGPPGEIMERPASEFVAGFVGTETILSGTVNEVLEGTFVVLVQGKRVELAGEARKGERITFCVRPETIVLSKGDMEQVSARNRFRGTVTRITALRPYSRVHVDCGFPLIAWITPHSVQELLLAEGVDIEASFKATAIHVIRRDAG
ncbi:MAG: ABC transporter ATP-binding protein [Spirochaetes bacterium]|nr:MAG: ABC transporter ATP-binding protein [Spirochaetota bacterium]